MDSIYLHFGLNGTFTPVTIVKTTATTDGAKTLNKKLIIAGVNEKKKIMRRSPTPSQQQSNHKVKFASEYYFSRSATILSRIMP